MKTRIETGVETPETDVNFISDSNRSRPTKKQAMSSCPVKRYNYDEKTVEQQFSNYRNSLGESQISISARSRVFGSSASVSIEAKREIPEDQLDLMRQIFSNNKRKFDSLNLLTTDPIFNNIPQPQEPSVKDYEPKFDYDMV